jgi:hypothetical protein
MEHTDEIQAVEKLMNTLGKKIAKEFYGLDLNFKVVSKEVDSPYYSPPVMFMVQTDKRLPNVLTVQNAEWGYGKYATILDLQGNLNRFLKYIGMNWKDVGLALKTPQGTINELPVPKEDDYINHPERFTPLIDKTYVLDNNTGWVHYLNWDDTIDTENAYHLSGIESEEFWENLTIEEKRILEKLYN